MVCASSPLGGARIRNNFKFLCGNPLKNYAFSESTRIFFFLKMLQLKFISALTSYVHKRLEIIQPFFLPWPNLQICKFALSFLCMFDFSRFGFTPVWLTSSRDFSELMGVSPSLLGHEGKASDSYNSLTPVLS